MKSKVVAISAISAGFVALSLIAGAYISVADLFALVVASVFVILPLYFGSYKGAFLAFLAGGVIALLCALPTIAMTVVFPAYAAFFGLYPIVRLWLREKNVHKAVVIAIGIVWCVAAVYGMYFYYTLVMGLSFAENLPAWAAWINNYILYFLAAFGLLFYVIYDRFVIVMKSFADRILCKVIK